MFVATMASNGTIAKIAKVRRDVSTIDKDAGALSASTASGSGSAMCCLNARRRGLCWRRASQSLEACRPFVATIMLVGTVASNATARDYVSTINEDGSALSASTPSGSEAAMRKRQERMQLTCCLNARRRGL